MRTVIIGGTFNPVHWGHLLLAEEVRIQAGYERILFIPSSKPAHKEVEGASVEQRLEMLELAVQGLPIRIETCEILRSGISYSIDTVRCVYRKYELTGKPALVIGDDLFENFSTWKDAETLCELADLLVAHRFYSHKIESAYPHAYIENKILPISSSEIRQRVATGQAWRTLVPPLVSRYIDDRNLYREGNSP